MCLNPLEIEGSTTEDMLWGDGFEIETLITVRIARAGLKVAQVPSFEAARHHGSSNLNALSDGFRVLRTIQYERKSASKGSQREEPSTQKHIDRSTSIKEAS